MKTTIAIARQFLNESHSTETKTVKEPLIESVDQSDESSPINEEDNRAFDKNGGFIEDAEQFFNLKSVWGKDIVKRLTAAGCRDHTATLVSLNKSLNRALEDWNDLDDDISNYLT